VSEGGQRNPQLILFGPAEPECPRPRRGRPPKTPKFLETVASSPDENSLAEIAAQVHSGLCQTALPYSKLADNSKAWERKGIGATLTITPGYARRIEGGERIPVGVPYGARARLIMIYIQTLGIRNRVVPLGPSMSGWMKSLGLSVTGGRKGTISEVKEQILRLANCNMIIEVQERRKGGLVTTEHRAAIASGLQLWAAAPGREQWPTEIELDAKFHEHLCANAVTLDRAAVASLSSHALGLDLYATLAHWLPRIDRPMATSWSQLVQAFGSDGERPSDFARRLRNVMPAVAKAYPDARLDVGRNGLLLYPSPPSVKGSQVGWSRENRMLIEGQVAAREIRPLIDIQGGTG